MHRLGTLLASDLTSSGRKEFMALGTHFLSALAADIELTDVTITQNATAISAYLGKR